MKILAAAICLALVAGPVAAKDRSKSGFSARSGIEKPATKTAQQNKQNKQNKQRSYVSGSATASGNKSSASVSASSSASASSAGGGQASFSFTGTTSGGKVEYKGSPPPSQDSCTGACTLTGPAP
jgi:hypothetical protein